MIYDFLTIDKNCGTALYVQLYMSIKSAIENGAPGHGEKLPSIRKLSEDLALSKTTVESAYQQLCVEGYIKNMPQRGYFVQAQTRVLIENEKEENNITYGDCTQRIIKYDLSSKSVDVSSTNLKLWRKYIKDILNREYMINSYGDPQGEPELRQALSSYSYGVRGVCADRRHIVIGAGTQSLLYLICGLLKKHGNTVAVETNASRHAMQVFADCGMDVVTIDSDDDGIDPEKLMNSTADFLLINPSGSLKTGRSIKMNRRYELLQWAAAKNSFIIEDDYNGELRYKTRPIPALQGHDKERVIYLGSFSKLLLPSVRIGYAVLPQTLAALFEKRAEFYNQTASKAEQLALAKYISDGQLERHLRRLRKQYSEKSILLLNALNKSMPKGTCIKLLETSLAAEVKPVCKLNCSLLYERLLNQGIKIIIQSDDNTFKLGFSGIPASKISDAIKIISETIKSASS